MLDKDLLRLLLKNGWKLIRVQGSHHVIQKGQQTEVIAIHGKDIPKGLLIKIMKRTNLIVKLP